MSDKRLISIKEVWEKYEAQFPKTPHAEIEKDEAILYTGFNFLDQQVGGFHKGEVVMFCSSGYDRPDLVFSLLDNICVERNKTTLFFSEEHAAKCLEGLVRIKTGAEPEFFWHMVNVDLSTRYKALIKSVEMAPLYITARAKAQVQDIEAFCDSYFYAKEETQNIDLIVIDNMNISPFYAQSEQVVVQVKRIAQKYNCVVFFMASESLMRDQNALAKSDVVIGVSTGGGYIKGNASFDICKNKRGNTISFEVSHNRSFGKFAEIDTVVF